MTAIVLSKSSKTPILESAFAIFTSIWDCTQRRIFASLIATFSCIFAGKNERNLVKVSPAELVCKVLKTKCQLSATLSTVSAVSVSRISQTNTISGSCLMSPLRAFLKDRLSCPISLWEMMHLFCLNTNSIGSSIVIIFSFLIELIYSSIETIEVDFPLPVGQVTRKSHFFAVKILDFSVSAWLENIISSSLLTVLLIFLITIQIFPVSKKAFTL